MQLIPISAVPSQTFSASLDGQAASFALYQLGAGEAGEMFMDLTSNGVSIFSAKQCRAYGGLPNTRARFMLTGRRYLGFLGDLLFLDTQATALNPTEDPQASGLGARWQLMYFTEADLEDAGLVS